jgi:hypothetical protein
MIVGDLFSNLGNQLFIYAATKSIALDLGYKYGYRVIKPGFAASGDCLDAYGHEYSEGFEQAFHIDTSERIDVVPSLVNSHWTWQRTADTNFINDVYEIPDNTRLDGYFLCPKYFEHRRQQVLEWFRFKKEYFDKCIQTCNAVIEKTGADHFVSIHIRCGKDYRQFRLVIDPEYHRNAIRLVRKKFEGEKLCFILFSDVPDEAKRVLKNEGEDIIPHHGTMFEDLCLMTLCDSHIIANSSFSWWGAWLSESNKGIVIRPAVWPLVHNRFDSDDIFPSDWLIVEARREKLTARIFVKRFRDIYPVAVLSGLRKVKSAIKKALKMLLPNILVTILKSLRR